MATNTSSKADLNQTMNDVIPIVVKTAGIVMGIEVARVIIHHRRLLATIATLAGAAYVANKGLPKFLTESPKPKVADAPSFQGDDVHPAMQEPEDEVDEAAMSSFPASDPPPSYHRA